MHQAQGAKKVKDAQAGLSSQPGVPFSSELVQHLCEPVQDLFSSWQEVLD